MDKSFVTVNEEAIHIANDGEEKTFPDPSKSTNTDLKGGVVLLFSLQCQGARWQGIISYQGRENVHVSFAGFPPVRKGQWIKIRPEGTISPSQEWVGQIVALQTLSKGSPWQGSTTVILEFPEGASARDRGPFLPCLTDVFSHQCGLRGDVALEWEAQDFAALPHARQIPRNGLCINTQAFALSKSNGQIIRGFHDFPTGIDVTQLPLALLVPGYGETKQDLVTLAYYFATNGFHVIRYDHTNHVGESDGNHFDVTLSSMMEDFQTITGFAQQTWPISRRVGVASSVATRVVLKAEAESPALAFLICMVGIVNLRGSITRIHQEDLFEAAGKNALPASANILGFNVGRQFIHDAVANNFSTRESTERDIQRLSTPVSWIAAGQDAWVSQQDLRRIKKVLGLKLREWVVVPGALHRLQENPRMARTTYIQLITCCQNHLENHAKSRVVYAPNQKELGRQKRKEKGLPRHQDPTKVRPEFWKEYLERFQDVQQCADYVTLLDHVFHALGPMTTGQSLLDVGCGNGNAGTYFLQNIGLTHGMRSGTSSKPTRYVGIDLVNEALERAKAHMTEEYQSLCQEGSFFSPFMHLSWLQHDLNLPLPFADNRFDRIISNLVLGYIKNPHTVLQDLYRILAPGGRMVLSNLKPDGDFSGIYQSLLEGATKPEHYEQARGLLNNYGKIRQAEKEGQFYFYDQRAWKMVLKKLNGAVTNVFSTFSQQGVLIVVDKPVVVSHIPTTPVHRSPSDVALPQSQSLFNHAA